MGECQYSIPGRWQGQGIHSQVVYKNVSSWLNSGWKVGGSVLRRSDIAEKSHQFAFLIWDINALLYFEEVRTYQDWRISTSRQNWLTNNNENLSLLFDVQNLFYANISNTKDFIWHCSLCVWRHKQQWLLGIAPCRWWTSSILRRPRNITLPKMIHNRLSLVQHMIDWHGL